MLTPLLFLLLALALGVGGISAAYHVIFRRPLPRTEGRMAVDGLSAEVEITRDGHGVPLVVAQNRRDACLALGFLHGQDRLWQMELQRRLAAGRLSEVVGPRAVGVDRLMRRLGMRRVSEAEWHVTHAAGELRQEVLAYTDGVNAALRDRPLPAEFTIIRHRPEPWTPEDTLAIGRVLSFSQAGNWEAQLIRMRLLKELGPDLTATLDPVFAGSAAQPLDDLAAAGVYPSTEWLDEMRAAEDLLGLSAWAPASNSWAVHGSRTLGGGAILANDPHAPIGIPSPWYRARIRAGGEELAGLTFCGAPYLLFGRNQRMAWGMVNANVSVQDLYVERFNPNNPLQFDDRGEWRDAVRFREVIRVRGGKPVVEDVLVTRRGPIISPAVGGTQPPMSLRWVGFDSEVDSIGWLRRLNLASDWRGFRAAVSSCPTPALGMTFADVEGNIGYRLGGFIPLRRAGQGRVPARGWAAADEWAGFIPLEEMPELFNPPTGEVIAANQPVALDTTPHPLVCEPSGGFRASRIHEALMAADVVTPELCEALQADTMSPAAVRFREIVLSLAARLPAGRPEAAVELLRGWDCRLDLESAEAALYERATAHLFEQLVGRRLSPTMRRYLLGAGATDVFPDGPYSGRLTPGLLTICARLVDGGRLDGVEAGPEVLWVSLDQAWAELAATQGTSPSAWRLGSLRAFAFEHPLAQAVSALRPVLSRGPFQAPGDADTVRVGTVTAADSGPGKVTAAFYRAVYDLRGEGSSWGHAPGQSGHPGSANYADLIDGWLAARSEPLPFGATPPGRRLVLGPKAQDQA
ncbi:MAG: penicillin acylase family protein [Candidatus Dormibacteria bacterium]